MVFSSQLPVQEVSFLRKKEIIKMSRKKEVSSFSSIAGEIKSLLSTEETWMVDLKRKIAREVKARHNWQIKREIEDEFEFTQYREKQKRKENLEQLRERVAQGESTGDPNFDIVFVLTGKAESKLIDKVQTLRERVDQALQEEENPLLLEIHFLKESVNYLSLTQISQPGLSLWTDEQRHNLGFSASGYASWSEIQERYHFPTDYASTPFHLNSPQLMTIEPGFSFEETASRAGQIASLSFILIGKKEIGSFLQDHLELQSNVSSLHGILSQNLDQEITPLEELLHPSLTFPQ